MHSTPTLMWKVSWRGCETNGTPPRGGSSSALSSDAVISPQNCADTCDERNPRLPARRAEKSRGIDCLVGRAPERAGRIDDLRAPAERLADRLRGLPDRYRSARAAVDHAIFERGIGRQDGIELIVDIEQVPDCVGFAPHGEFI